MGVGIYFRMVTIPALMPWSIFQRTSAMALE